MSLPAAYLGVDLGRSTRVAIVDESGSILWYRRARSLLSSGRELIDGMATEISEALEQARDEYSVRAIGIGFPGLVEHDTNQVVALPNLSDVSMIDIHHEISERTGLPVVFENDANAAAYGEWHVGFHRKANDLIYIGLGTGIGAGINQGGQLQRGARGFAGEFGHLKIATEGIECSCGSFGCLETIASGPNIVRRTRERLFSDPSFSRSSLAAEMSGRLTCDQIVEAAIAGDLLAQAILSETGLFLGMAVSNVVNLLNVEMVLFGGPVMNNNQFLLKAVVEQTATRSFTPSFTHCSIRLATLGERAGVIGAAVLAHHLIENRDSTRTISSAPHQ